MSKNNPLIIAGSARSGTTWVLDVLAETNNLRPVFEPLNPVGVREARFFCNRYVPQNAREPEFKGFMEKIFNGEMNCLWTNTRLLPHLLRPAISKMASWNYDYDLLSRYKKLFIRYSDYLRRKSFLQITKLIRANLMLDWLEVNFQPKIIFIVRHPGAVAASKIVAAKTKRGGVWDFNGPNQQSILFRYKNDERLRRDYLNKYYEIFSEKLSPVAGATLIWCIENILPIYNLQKKKHYVFFYEDIVHNPAREFKRMVKMLGLNKCPDSSIIRQPSQQASNEMKKGPLEEDQLTRWMKNFSQQQLTEMDEILKFFNVAIYDAYEPMPVSRVQNTI